MVSLLYIKLRRFKDEMEYGDGIEGYVITFDNGHIVKAKTKWYVLLHRVVTNIRECDVAEMVVCETIDDYKAYINSLPDDKLLATVEQIENVVLTDIIDIKKQVENALMENSNLPVSEFAKKFNTHVLFHLMIAIKRGKEANYNEYYLKNVIETKFSKEYI